MRKVTPQNMTKPTMKVMLQVFLPFNDGSGGGEIVEAQDLCFMDESTNDIAKMAKKLITDAKEIATHQAKITKLRASHNRNYTHTPTPAAAPAVPAGLDKLLQAAVKPPVAAKKKVRKK